MTTLLRAAALTLALSILAALSPAAGAAPSEAPKPPANDEVANAQAIHALPSEHRRHDRRSDDGAGGSAVELCTRHDQLGVVQPAYRPGGAAGSGRTGRGRQAGRHDRRVQGGALAAAAGRLPGDRRRRQGVADVQGEEEHRIRDPRGGAPHLPAGRVHAQRLPAHPRDRAARAPAARRRRQRPGRSHPEQQRGLLDRHARRGQLPGQPRQRDEGWLRERRAVRAGDALLRRSLRALSRQLRRLPAVHPRAGQGRDLQLRGDPGPRTQGRAALPPAGDGGQRHANHPGGRTRSTTGAPAGAWKAAASRCCASIGWTSPATPT